VWEGLPVRGAIGQSGIGKFFATAIAAMALAPFAVVATTPFVTPFVAPFVAQAAPCAGDGANPVSCQNCLVYVEAYHTSNVCYNPAPPRPAPSPSRAPVSIPEAPPEPVPLEPAPPVRPPRVVPPSPTTVPVQVPKLNRGAPGLSKNASMVAPPKGLDAAPQAIADAKAAPATRINPASPLEPPSRVYDFSHQVRNAVEARGGSVESVKVGSQQLVRPRHWEYIDYDDNHRPTLYNPLTEAMTFRYFYDGAYREAFVPAGGRIVLDAAAVGLFPFTAVGFSHVAAGSFYGGASIPPPGSDAAPPPNYTAPTPLETYQDVSTFVAAANQTVGVGQVQVLGHDDRQPVGSQDSFLLDDSTLAWGQVNDPGGPAQITVVRTQSLPGAGPTDNGGYLVALAALKEPAQPSEPWWPSALSYGGLAIAVSLGVWMIDRRKRSPGPAVGR
jgi:hypothetical protein